MGGKVKYPLLLKRGMKFGRLTITNVDVSSTIGKENCLSKWRYFCKCDCGNPQEKSIQRLKLVRGETKSCGCLQKEKTREINSKINPVEDYGDYIKLYFFNKSHGYTILDKEDYPTIKNYCWFKSTIGYAVTNNEHGETRLHRMIMGAPSDFLIDHKDRNKLNNKKSNLRFCNKSENGRNTDLSKANTSGRKGVWFHDKNQKWIVELYHKGQKHNLGSFTYFEQACTARKNAELKYHGRFTQSWEEE